MLGQANLVATRLGEAQVGNAIVSNAVVKGHGGSFGGVVGVALYWGGVPRERYSNSTSMSPLCTAMPTLTGTDLTVPDTGAVTSVSIFIASRMMSESPSLTS